MAFSEGLRMIEGDLWLLEWGSLWELQQFDLIKINLLKCDNYHVFKNNHSSLLVALPSGGDNTSQGNTNQK